MRSPNQGYARALSEWNWGYEGRPKNSLGKGPPRNRTPWRPKLHAKATEAIVNENTNVQKKIVQVTLLLPSYAWFT